MKNFQIILLSLVMILLGSCSPTIAVRSDFERGTNFQAYQTYQMLKHKDGFPIGINPINRQRLERAIHNEMKALQYSEAADPDLLVAYYVSVEKHRDYYTDYYGRWRPISRVQMYEYKVGTLVVDLIDAKQNLIVWHGSTSDRIEDDMGNAQEKINATVAAIFEKYATEANLKTMARR